MTETEKAWLAGIIDGEGCISISKRNGKKAGKRGYCYRLSLCVRMTHEPTIKRLTKLTFLGKCLKQIRDKTRKNSFTWTIWSRQAEKVLKQVCPYLLTKGKNAQNALNFMNCVSKTNRNGKRGLTDNEWNRQDSFYKKSKELNHVRF